ncbi:MAG: hypothetical protein EBQ85_02690 [Proteobacteria bacterium]|nr:hypothetical protein [Pseudomonadota bacterium]
MTRFFIGSWLILSISGFSFAAAEKLEENAVQSKNLGKVLGVIDLRPTVAFKGQDSFRFENSMDVGYRFNPSSRLIYHQDFWTNLYNSVLVGGNDGLGLQIHDGYFDWLAENIFENADKSLSISYDARVYVPTFTPRRDAGMVTAIRNYLIVGKKLNETFSLVFVETPILHVYDRAVHEGRANPLAENRMTFEVDINLTSKLALSLPVIWSAMKMRAAEGVSGSGSTDSFIWVNPELSYSVNDNLTMGLGYYDTSSLIKADFSSFQIFEGLEDAVVQMFLRASL